MFPFDDVIMIRLSMSLRPVMGVVTSILIGKKGRQVDSNQRQVIDIHYHYIGRQTLELAINSNIPTYTINIHFIYGAQHTLAHDTPIISKWINNYEMNNCDRYFHLTMVKIRKILTRSKLCDKVNNPLKTNMYKEVS